VKTLALAATALAAAAISGSAGATTIHQVQHLADGSTVTFTLSDQGGYPAAGTGVDVGDFGSSSGSSHSGMFMPAAGGPVVSVATAPSAIPAAVSGQQTMHGSVSFSNIYGVTLWTYGETVSWSYGNYTVLSIFGQTAGSLNTCCLWGFHGNISLTHTPAGGPNFNAFAQGTFQACVVWACETKSPWITLTGNGNGNMTGFSWGIG
jgi:hypothetical protein